MLMVIPNEGKLKWLQRALGLVDTEYEGWYLHLYQNNYTPDDGSNISSFVLATFTGYVGVAIAVNNFDLPTLIGDVADTLYSPVPVYECTGGSSQTIYGWYLEGTESGVVYAAQRFDTPRVMSVGSVEALDPYRLKLKTFTVCP